MYECNFHNLLFLGYNQPCIWFKYFPVLFVSFLLIFGKKILHVKIQTLNLFKCISLFFFNIKKDWNRKRKLWTQTVSKKLHFKGNEAQVSITYSSWKVLIILMAPKALNFSTHYHFNLLISLFNQLLYFRLKIKGLVLILG